ncbi:hypothetical protein GY45DRAFT_135521 [Cubamyces sp. BRFM 1775]|nr:hypothetical protein GY45DRAFT_135521 [Cubamyces sp. BRFM 1775]
MTRKKEGHCKAMTTFALLGVLLASVVLCGIRHDYSAGGASMRMRRRARPMAPSRRREMNGFEPSTTRQGHTRARHATSHPRTISLVGSREDKGGSWHEHEHEHERGAARRTPGEHFPFRVQAGRRRGVVSWSSPSIQARPISYMLAAVAIWTGLLSRPATLHMGVPWNPHHPPAVRLRGQSRSTAGLPLVRGISDGSHHLRLERERVRPCCGPSPRRLSRWDS